MLITLRIGGAIVAARRYQIRRERYRVVLFAACVSLLALTGAALTPPAHAQGEGDLDDTLRPAQPQGQPDKVEIDKIDIQLVGVPADIKEAVFNSLTIARRRNSERLNNSYVRRLHSDTPTELKRLLQAYGFYLADVNPSLGRTEQGWSAIYNVVLGQPVTIEFSEVHITGEGHSESALQNWLSNFPLSSGDVFVHSDWEDAKQSLLQIAQKAGYLSGELTQHEVRINKQRTKARLLLHYDTGPILTVNEIRFTQDAFDETFLRRFVTLGPGERFVPEKLADLQQRLSRSEHFSRVDVKPNYERILDGNVAVDVALTPRKPLKYSFGLGFGTDTGARANAGFEHRRINRRGHRFSSGFRFSTLEQTLQANYRVPLTDPLDEQLLYFVNFIDKENDNRNRRTAAIGVNYISRWRQWEKTLGLSYEHESFMSPDEVRTNLLIPAMSLNRVSADNAARPNRGWRILLGLKGAADSLFSDSTFAQLSFKGKAVQAIGKGRFIARADVGTTIAEDFSQLPLSVQYFTGGDSSVRGYAFESLFPDNSDGSVGGENLFVASVEYEYPVTEQVALAAFVDVGDAYSETFSLKRGAGLGLRWQLPFGAVRFDVAAALDRVGTPWRVHLTVGPDL